MTNGEKLCIDFPDMHYTLSEKQPRRVITTIGVCASFDLEWWNAEYKEPSNSGKPNKSEIPTGSTTKKCTTCAYREIDGKPHEMCKSCVCGNRYREDAISRNEVLEMIDQINDAGGFIGYNTYSAAFDVVDNMPPVTLMRPKGHWIDHSDEGYVECPKCGSATNCDDNIADLHFCFSCGADMRGEGKECK